MTRGVILLALAGIPMMGVVGCSTAPKTQADRADLKADADRVVAEAQRTDPGLRDFMARSAGYAVFPAAGQGGLVVGGAYGKGVLYEHGVMTGYCDMTEANIGAQVGGKKFAEIICFETQDKLNQFKSGDYAFSAEATAVALKSGAAANAKYQDNVAVFVVGQEGLMAEAAVGGQKFRFTPAESPNGVRPAGQQIPGNDSDVESTGGNSINDNGSLR